MQPLEPVSAHEAHHRPAERGWRGRPVVLVGLMGAGKSTIGRRLAKQIGWRFVDSDEEIEAAAGCRIADIFSVHGEPIFRDLEQRVITRLLGEEPLVLATGPLLRVDFQDHVVLVGLRLELIDLTLTKRVVESFVDIGGGEAEAVHQRLAAVVCNKHPIVDLACSIGARYSAKEKVSCDSRPCRLSESYPSFHLLRTCVCRETGLRPQLQSVAQ